MKGNIAKISFARENQARATLPCCSFKTSQKALCMLSQYWTIELALLFSLNPLPDPLGGRLKQQLNYQYDYFCNVHNFEYEF